MALTQLPDAYRSSLSDRYRRGGVGFDSRAGQIKQVMSPRALEGGARGDSAFSTPQRPPSENARTAMILLPYIY